MLGTLPQFVVSSGWFLPDVEMEAGNRCFVFLGGFVYGPGKKNVLERLDQSENKQELLITLAQDVFSRCRPSDRV